jgi:hypothetical protein
LSLGERAVSDAPFFGRGGTARGFAVFLKFRKTLPLLMFGEEVTES